MLIAFEQGANLPPETVNLAFQASVSSKLQSRSETLNFYLPILWEMRARLSIPSRCHHGCCLVLVTGHNPKMMAGRNFLRNEVCRQCKDSLVRTRK